MSTFKKSILAQRSRLAPAPHAPCLSTLARGAGPPEGGHSRREGGHHICQRHRRFPMDTQLVLSGAQNAMTARRVFGDVIQADGVTLIPAAIVGGGGG